MESTTKEKVLHHLKHSREFPQACRLYRGLPNQNQAILRRMNAGFNKSLLDTIHYELAKAVGIPAPNFQAIISKKLVPVESAEETKTNETKTAVPFKIVEFDPEKLPLEQIPLIDVQNGVYGQLRFLAKRLELDLPDEKGDTIKAALEDYQKTAIAKKAVQDLPEEAQKAIRLRDEFPFLNEKDCPDEYKILVSDRIACYHRYVDAHELIKTGTLTEEQLQNAAGELVENFLENRQIFDELRHYQDKKQPLGKHPIFRTQQLVDEIQKLNATDLAKKKASLSSSRSSARKNILKEQENETPDQAKITDWESLIEEKEWLIEVVEKRLAEL